MWSLSNIFNLMGVNTGGTATSNSWYSNNQNSVILQNNNTAIGQVTDNSDATIKRRPLTGLASSLYLGRSIYNITPLYSVNKLLDVFNIEPEHFQIFYEDKEGGNVGFFDDKERGTVDKDKDENLPLYKETNNKHYDDAIMRKAVENVETKPYHVFWVPGEGEKYNCQDFIDDVIKEYKRLEKVSK
jgi:hypothetical protein